MLTEGMWNDPLQVPERGGVRTYVSMGIFDKAEIFPILEGGGKCELADEISFDECIDPNAIQYVGSP